MKNSVIKVRITYFMLEIIILIEVKMKSLIEVKWGWSHNKKRIAYFDIPREDNVKTLVGDEIKLKCIKEDDYTVKWEAKGYVIKISRSSQEYADEIAVELKSALSIPTESWKRFAIEFVWKPTSYNRMKKGLRIFTTDTQSITGYLFYKILGKPQKEIKYKIKQPKNLSVKGLPQLNIYQLDAISLRYTL